MLNLRQLSKADNTETNSDARHVSRSSIEFKAPSNLLGNIGEPLDHSQSERLYESEHEEHDAPDEGWHGAGVHLESAGSVAGPSGARWDDEDETCKSIVGTSAGPARARADDDAQASPQSAGLSAGPSGIRSDKIVDASHYMDEADNSVIDLTEEVCLSRCLYLCNPRLRMIFFTDTRDSS